MDDVRDVQRANSLSKYVDGHPVRTTPFGANKAAERLYARCERISIAVFLLTSHVVANDPIKTRIRSASLDLMDAALEMREEMRSPESEFVIAFTQSVRSLISLVRAAAAAGYISIHNAEILSGAIDELGTFMTASQRSNMAEHILLTKEDLVGPIGPLTDTGRMSFIKDVKDRPYVKDIQAKDTTQSMSNTAKLSVPLNTRAQAIMQILVSGRELGIKDICNNLPEYSEKMIQRELAELVREGKVKKEGDKRWSRYSLAQAQNM